MNETFLHQLNKRYYGLSEILDAPIGRSPPYVLAELKKGINHEAVANLFTTFELNHFKVVGHGRYALVLSTFSNSDNPSGGTVVRLSIDKNESPRIWHPAILQPVISYVVGDGDHAIRVEFLPYVTTEGVTDEHRTQLYNALRASGIGVNDLFLEGNVGLITVNAKTVPVLLDPGTIAPLRVPREDSGDYEEIPFKPWRTVKEHLAAWLDNDGETWLQRIYDPRIFDNDPERMETLNKYTRNGPVSSRIR